MKKLIGSVKYRSLTDFIDKIMFINGPEYRGAAMPRFEPDGLNVSEFADELRPKSLDIKILTDEDIQLDYISQGWGTPEEIDELADEFRRMLTYLVDVYRKNVDPDASLGVSLNIKSRDGDGPAVLDFNI